MSALSGMSPGRRTALQMALIWSLLLAPSAWMLATVPPLWRDADAYFQVTSPPGEATVEGQAPLYPLLVRLPLFLGYHIAPLLGDPPAAERFSFSHPPVTDAGILILLCAQHLALCAGGFGLIVASTQLFWGRVLLAIVFAINSVFYTFAHCVGSESLSLVCTLALTLTGLRLLKCGNEDRRKWWGLFALALLACVLSRYANLLLILALPLTFVLLALLRRSLAPLRQAALALAIGVLCLGVGRLTAELLCQSVGQPYYARGGFTFLWRLSFLESVSAPDRTALLDKVAARAASADARQLFVRLREMLDAHEPLVPFPVLDRFRAALSTPDRPVETRRLHEALNSVERAFILPPTREHWRAAEEDIANILGFSLQRVSDELFFTTWFCFRHPEDLPLITHLSTFRKYTPGELMAFPKERLYFQATKVLSLGAVFALWLAAAAAVALLSQRTTQHDLGPILLYAIALVATGVLILQATALLAQLIARYTLPAWALLWVSGMILLGTICQSLSRSESLTGRRSPSPPD